MSYEPRWYLIKYVVGNKKEEKYFHAEDAHEAISELELKIPNAEVDSVFVEVELGDEDEDYDEDEED